MMYQTHSKSRYVYRMSQFVGGNLCWRFLRKFTFGGFYFGDFLHLQELGVARVNNQLLLADFILAIYLSTANPPTLIPRQQIDSYGIRGCVVTGGASASFEMVNAHAQSRVLTWRLRSPRREIHGS